MNAASLTQVVGFLVALGSVSGLVMFFVSRWDKKRDPVSKAEAEVALAAKALGMVEGINDRLIGEVGRLDSKIEAMEARHAAEREEDRLEREALEARHALEREEDRTKIDGLERRMAAVIEDRDQLVKYVNDMHLWFEAGAPPPAPDVPERLADVIPKWMPADGEELRSRRNPKEKP